MSMGTPAGSVGGGIPASSKPENIFGIPGVNPELGLPPRSLFGVVGSSWVVEVGEVGEVVEAAEVSEVGFHLVFTRFTLDFWTSELQMSRGSSTFFYPGEAGVIPQAGPLRCWSIQPLSVLHSNKKLE